MDHGIKGKLSFINFESRDDEIKLSAVCPDGWVMSDRDDGREIIYSNSKNEINVRLVVSRKERVFPKATHAVEWYHLLLDDFIPKEVNYDNISLSGFTSNLLDDACCYSISSIDREKGRFLRHDFIVISPSKVVVIKANVENEDALVELVESFILSVGYKDKNELRETLD